MKVRYKNKHFMILRRGGLKILFWFQLSIIPNIFEGEGGHRRFGRFPKLYHLFYLRAPLNKMFLKFDFTTKYFWGKILCGKKLFSPSPITQCHYNQCNLISLNLVNDVSTQHSMDHIYKTSRFFTVTANVTLLVVWKGYFWITFSPSPPSHKFLLPPELLDFQVNN